MKIEFFGRVKIEKVKQMKAAGFVPTSIQQKAQEEEHAKHRKRIEKILTSNKKTSGSSGNLKMSQQLQKNMKAMHNEKFQSIDKDNKFLLEKLIEISRKKPGAVEKTEVSQSKSLHGTYRKKEMVRISMENEAFAKRLLAQQSTFDRKKVTTDFKKHQALLSQIKRVSTSPNKGAQKKLPPLTLEIKIPKTEGVSTTNKSTTAKDINKSLKDQVASAPVREEKKSPQKIPTSAQQVETKKVDEVIAPEVPSEKAIDEKETERVEEAPKEEIKEKQPVAEEVVPIAAVEEKTENHEHEPTVQAQAEEDKNIVVEKPVESNNQIEEEIPKDEAKSEEGEKKEEPKPEANN